MLYKTLDANTALSQVLESVGKSERLLLCGSTNEQEFLEEQEEITSQTEEEIITASQSIDVKNGLRIEKLSPQRV